MQAIQPILIFLGLLSAGNDADRRDAAPTKTDRRDAAATGFADLAYLREKLHNRQHPHGQSQAALMLVQSREADAEKTVRDGLRVVENVEVFLALAAAVRLRRDRRFLDELFDALSCGRPVIREAAGRTLAVLSDSHLVTRLRQLADDDGADPQARQTALWTLGRCGTKDAARVLLEHLRGDKEIFRRAAAAALHDLSGEDFGVDAARWQAWWESRRAFSSERWLESRLTYQTSRAHRLDGDLTRARAQLLRLEQQLYSRLSPSERVSHIQSLLDQDDSAVRALAVAWSVELLPTVEAAHKRLLTQVLLRLSQDSAMEVRRAAVLGLGRISDVRVFERLQRLAHAAEAGDTPIPPAVRTAALHALTLHARGNDADAAARRKQIMPLLQKALDDPALEVVVEAAEDLGTLGAREAGPVLTGLLHHPSETVRQAAAQALERVAEPAVLPALFDALDDSCATVRFNLVGALAHATGGARLSEEQSKRLLARLEKLLQHDSDPGVRSRAATLLGECASPAQLPTLWRCVLAGEDVRVQEKAWTAFLDILTRTGQLALLREWDRKLTAARQGPRRLQMLAEVLARWQRQPPRKELLVPAQEMLVQAQLELGKWSAAVTLLRDLLARPSGETELGRRLGWLLTAGEQALHEGKRPEAQRIVEIAQPFLPSSGKLAAAFEKLRQKAAR